MIRWRFLVSPSAPPGLFPANVSDLISSPKIDNVRGNYKMNAFLPSLFIEKRKEHAQNLTMTAFVAYCWSSWCCAP